MLKIYKSHGVYVQQMEAYYNPGSRVQGLHPATSGICFSVVPSSNPRHAFQQAKWSASYQLRFLTMLCLFETGHRPLPL